MTMTSSPLCSRLIECYDDSHTLLALHSGLEMIYNMAMLLLHQILGIRMNSTDHICFVARSVTAVSSVESPASTQALEPFYDPDLSHLRVTIQNHLLCFFFPTMFSQAE
jgi:hypothetical protein